MTKSRLEAFSDGVLAIIITIMVLEMKVPHEASLQSLKPLIPVFLSYVLSFIYIGIYWNNHHNMLHAAKHINGSVMWANMHLLFWLSLFPFVTGWMGENNFATFPVVIYGVVAAMAGIAYYLLAHCLADLHGKDSSLAIALGKDWKGILSVVMYVAGAGLSFLSPWFGVLLYALVAAAWFIPDKRMEKASKSQ
ncbi:TMEM175 family protein [Terrimonas pollutisoli]|uniref:TMEM175 family protein n=1 Tax=Terrimonas pollutisoli TaxID=3034147 RepID=UPI0023EB0698|nr:TMEM175 family protein [Terrimonas sp. H1YJ31]